MSKDSSDESQIRQHHAMAMGQSRGNEGHGHLDVHKDTRVGYAKGGSVSKTESAGHHNMHGHKMEHHHTHKSHGHHPDGVKHHETESPFHGSGEHIKEDSHGPSNNQFGEHTPHGGTLGKW